MVLLQKWPFFQLFFLANLGQENVFYDILERKNAFLGYKNMKQKKSKNWYLSKGVNPWFWSKNGHFSDLFFKPIQARKMSFTIFQNEKTPFYAIKTRSSKSRKMDIFPKGLTHGFGPKMAIFPTSYFLSNLKKENVFYDILERKEAFLHYKNRKSIKQKNWNFSKGVIPLFWSKNGHFSNFLFLINLNQENVFYYILKRKNAFLGYKNKKQKK